MFLHTWRKYLPVIILLMKRSGKSEQVLNMNQTDFERAAGGKKAKLTFSNLKLDNGRTNYDSNYSPLAKDLIAVLQENEQTGAMMRQKQFEFSLNSSFQLTITNTTVNEEKVVG